MFSQWPKVKETGVNTDDGEGESQEGIGDPQLRVIGKEPLLRLPEISMLSQEWTE